MALIEDIVSKARRVLGDVRKNRWSDVRMLDLANSGMRDINKQVGAFRDLFIFELQRYRYRYPLPPSLLQVTSINYMGHDLPVIAREDHTQYDGVIASKSQISRGVLELAQLPDIGSRLKRFVQSPTLFETNPDGSLSVIFNPDEGTVDNGFGIVVSAAIPGYDYNTAIPTTYGLLTSMLPKGEEASPLNVTTVGSLGVLTDISVAGEPLSGGAITDSSNQPIRVVGRYGIITGVLKQEEYVKVYYKAVPPEAKALSDGFPLSVSLEEALLYWIVGSALIDDNDANNMARSDKFMNLYMRELQSEHKMGARNYASNSKRSVKYNGGIIK